MRWDDGHGRIEIAEEIADDKEGQDQNECPAAAGKADGPFFPIDLEAVKTEDVPACNDSDGDTAEPQQEGKELSIPMVTKNGNGPQSQKKWQNQYLPKRDCPWFE